MRTGRPTDYTPELGVEMCALIAEGETVFDLCEQENMPDKSTFFRWLYKYDDFRDIYLKAKKAQTHFIAEEIRAIADDGQNDWVERESKRTGETSTVVNAEHIQRSKLRVETRLKIMAMMNSHTYGETKRTELTGKDGAPLFEKLTQEQIDARLKSLNGDK